MHPSHHCRHLTGAGVCQWSVLCQLLTPAAPCAAALGPCLPLVTSPVTNQSYYLNSSVTDFAGAELACNNNGGHLVSYNRCVPSIQIWVLHHVIQSSTPMS